MNEADPSTGSDTARHDWGMGSTFYVPKNHPRYKQWKRLLHLHQHIHQRPTPAARHLRDIMIDLDKLSERLGMPKNIQREIAYLYRKLKKSKLTAGRDHWSVLAALAYAACARMNIQRTDVEFSESAHTSRRLLRRTLKKLTEESKMLSDYLKKVALQSSDPQPKIEFVEGGDRQTDKLIDPRLEQIKFAESWRHLLKNKKR